MTNTHNPIDTEAPQDVTEAPQDAPQATDEHEADHEPADAAHGHEAARYRRQLRETQAQLDTARQATEAAQRALVEHMTRAEGRIRPAALWASGAQIESLLDEAGNVDVAKVSAACDAATNVLGLSRTPKADPSAGRSTAVRNDWASAFSPTH